MKQHWLLASAIALSMPGAASAAVVYDTALAAPNNIPTSGTNPSFYNGTGNPQGAFTVVDASGIELGLRAKLRSVATLYDSADGTYVFSTGTTGGRALWNYDFSIDLRPGGVGTLTLGDLVAATLTITDVTTGAIATINPLNYWGDSSGIGTIGDTNAVKHSPQTAFDWSMQNSENLSFADSPLGSGFNPWNGDTYTFALSVTLPGAVVVSDTITVQTVPEPATFAMFGAALGGLVLLRRRTGALTRA